MIEVRHADCAEALKEIPDASVDLVLTSPPYNAGKEYEGKVFAAPLYCDFIRSWVPEIPRILKDTGSFWLNVGYMKTGRNTTLPLTYLYHEYLEDFLDFVQEVVWHYEGGMGYKLRFTHRTERWQWWSKDADRATFNLDAVRDPSLNRTQDSRNNPLGKNPTDYWYFDRVVGGTGRSSEKTAHPCQFPEAMIERVVKACSNEGDLIVDPFVGSGTTCVVAKRLGRRCLGLEKDPSYVSIARERIGS